MDWKVKYFYGSIRYRYPNTLSIRLVLIKNSQRKVGISIPLISVSYQHFEQTSQEVYVLRELSKYFPIQVVITAYEGLIYQHLSYELFCGVRVGGGAQTQIIPKYSNLKKIRKFYKFQGRESCRQAFKNLQLLTLLCLYTLLKRVFFLNQNAI